MRILKKLLFWLQMQFWCNFCNHLPSLQCSDFTDYRNLSQKK